MELLFQNGPVEEVGVNGVSVEGLLLVLLMHASSEHYPPSANKMMIISYLTLALALLTSQREEAKN